MSALALRNEVVNMTCLSTLVRIRLEAVTDCCQTCDVQLQNQIAQRKGLVLMVQGQLSSSLTVLDNTSLDSLSTRLNASSPVFFETRDNLFAFDLASK